MTQIIHYPSPPELSEYINSYGILERYGGVSEPYISPPLGLCGFIISLYGTNTATINCADFLRHPHSVTGQITFPVVGSMEGKAKAVLVFIHPLGLYQLFGCTMSLLTNNSVPLSEFLGQERYETLLRQLTQADSNEAQIGVLNEFFLAQKPTFEVADYVINALDYIHLHQGKVRIKDIETQCFIARRRLERHFQVCVGLSPKVYAKIFRFKCLMVSLQGRPSITWSELSEQNGYFDHSHLTRSFIEFLAVKPHELAYLNVDLINYLVQV